VCHGDGWDDGAKLEHSLHAICGRARSRANGSVTHVDVAVIGSVVVVATSLTTPTTTTTAASPAATARCTAASRCCTVR
jgi:hypothetical protein